MDEFPSRIKEIVVQIDHHNNWGLKNSLVSESENLLRQIESFDIWRAYEAEPQLSSNTRFGRSEISKGLGKYKSIIKHLENLYQALVANQRIEEFESFLNEANSFKEEFKIVSSELLSPLVERKIRNQFNIPCLILQNKYFEIIKNIKNFILLLKKFTVHWKRENRG